MSATIQARTIEGVTYLSAPDLVTMLRGRATEIEQLAERVATNAGEQLTASERTRCMAYLSVAMELHLRADFIDLAVIEHVTEHPGDSGHAG